jgi:Beta propeller domain
MLNLSAYLFSFTRDSTMAKPSRPSDLIYSPKQLLAVAAMACTGAALVVACGGGGASTPTMPTMPIVPTAVELTASTPGDLLNYVKTKIKQGAVQESNFNTTGVAVATGVPSPVAAPTAATPGADSAATFSGTRLQELGVDEDDLVKTDGSMLYALTKSYWNGTATVPARLQAQRRQADGQLAAAGSLVLGPDERSGIYLVSTAKRVALLGQQYSYGAAAIDPTRPVASVSIAPNPSSQKIGLDIVSLDVPDTLTLAKRVRIDGQLVGSRMVGNTLYLASTWSPNLFKYALPATATAAEQDARLASLTSSEVLPTVQIDDNPAVPLLADSDCYVQASNAAVQVQITSITAFDLSSPALQRSSRCFVGGSEALYMSPTNVYLTSSRYYSFDPSTTALANTVFRSGTTTDIHKFGLQGQTISYKGSGAVPGHLGWNKDKLAYRMSEYQGDLRVLSFTGQTGWSFAAPMPGIATVGTGTGTPTITVTTSSGTGVSATPTAITTAPASPATLTILREVSGQGLQVVGSLPNTQRPAALGHPGEQVYAVQFVGPRAYVVTFRQTDPLYVLDVGNPADPKTLGELSMPGFSDYLYPLGDKLLLGVGKDATDAGFLGGVKVALMDVTDPTKPSLLNSVVIGKRGSSSTLDYTSHGINVFQQGNVYRIAVPVRVHETPSSLVVGPQTFYQPTYQGLQRFEVDATAKTLVGKPVVNSIVYSPTNPYPQTYGLFDVAQDRSVQIEAMLYYFSGGRFVTAAW